MNAHDRQQRVGDDVEGDEQPVVALYHRRSRRRGQRFVDHRAACAPTWCSRENRSACARMRARSNAHRRDPRRAHVPASAGVGSSNEHAGVARRSTVSSAPPRPSATTGVPHACASTGTMPKSSSPGSSTASGVPVLVADLLVADAAEKRRRDRRPAASSRSRSGPSPTIRSARADTPARVDGQHRSACTGRGPTRRGNDWPGRRRGWVVKDSCRPGDTRSSPRDYSIGAILPATY